MILESELTKEYYKPGEIGSMVGRTARTIYTYFDEGRIEMFYTPTNKLMATRDSVIKFLEDFGVLAKDSELNKRDVIYSRVSSQDQKNSGDLDRLSLKLIQGVEGLNNPAIITDVGSSSDTQRPGLLSLFDLVDNGDVRYVIVSDEDQLASEGFDYLERYFNSQGTEIFVAG